MKFILPLAILVLVPASCTTTNRGELAPISSIRTTAREGTLTNPVLAQDASLAIRKIMKGNARVIKFVIQQPVGATGNKAWRELWVYEPEGRQQKFILTFREDGQGSANFEIQKM